VLVIAVFLVVVLACELVTRAISARLLPPDWGGEVTYKYQQIDTLAAGPTAVDTVFLGDSMTDAGVEPGTFADSAPATGTSYNAALLGAPLSAQRLWSDQIVLDRLQPRLAVVGVNPFAVSTLGVGAQDRFTYGEVITDNIRSLDDDGWDRANALAEDHLHLVRYRSSLRNPRLVLNAAWQTATGEGSLEGTVRPPGFWEQNVSPSGQVVSYGGGQATAVAPQVLADNIRTMLDAELVMAPLDEVVASLQARGISVVLAVPPTALDIMANSDIDVDRWRAAVGRIGDRARELDVPFVDFTDAGYDRSLFFDPLHLNRAGSARYSAELGSRVNQLCRTDDRVRCGR
jgi:hypothetical protein